MPAGGFYLAKIQHKQQYSIVKVIVEINNPFYFSDFTHCNRMLNTNNMFCQLFKNTPQQTCGIMNSVKTATVCIETCTIQLFTAIGLSPDGSGYFTCKQNMKSVTTKFKSGGLHEKHVVATWNVGNHLSICLQAQGNREKPCRGGRSQDLPSTDFQPAVRQIGRAHV